MARSLFAKLSLEEAPSVNVNVEITPEDVVEATTAADDLNEAEQVVTEALVTLEEAEEALGELQEADNAAAAALGEEPADIVTGEPANAEAPVEGDASPSTEPVEATADESNVDPVEVPTENQEVAAAVVQEALRHCYKKLGMDFNRVRVSYESIANQPKAALKLAREEAQEAGKSLWEKIKEFITNLIAGLKNLFAKAMSYITTNVKTLERLLNQVDSMAKDPSGNISESLATSLFNSKEFLLTAAITSGHPKTFNDLIDGIVTVSKDGTNFAIKLKGATTVDGLQASLAEQSQYLFSKIISTDDEGKANVSIDISDIKNIPLLSKINAKSVLRTVINQMELCTKKQVPTYEEASKTLLKIAKDKELGAEAQKAFKEAGKVVSVNSKKLIKINTELMKFTAKIVLESIKAANGGDASKEDQ